MNKKIEHVGDQSGNEGSSRNAAVGTVNQETAEKRTRCATGDTAAAAQRRRKTGPGVSARKRRKPFVL